MAQTEAGMLISSNQLSRVASDWPYEEARPGRLPNALYLLADRYLNNTTTHIICRGCLPLMAFQVLPQNNKSGLVP